MTELNEPLIRWLEKIDEGTRSALNADICRSLRVDSLTQAEAECSEQAITNSLCFFARKYQTRGL